MGGVRKATEIKRVIIWSKWKDGHGVTETWGHTETWGQVLKYKVSIMKAHTEVKADKAAPTRHPVQLSWLLL